MSEAQSAADQILNGFKAEVKTELRYLRRDIEAGRVEAAAEAKRKDKSIEALSTEISEVKGYLLRIVWIIVSALVVAFLTVVGVGVGI